MVFIWLYRYVFVYRFWFIYLFKIIFKYVGRLYKNVGTLFNCHSLAGVKLLCFVLSMHRIEFINLIFFLKRPDICHLINGLQVKTEILLHLPTLYDKLRNTHTSIIVFIFDWRKLLSNSEVKVWRVIVRLCAYLHTSIYTLGTCFFLAIIII